VKLVPVASVAKDIVKPYIKLPKIWIDNYVFRLHCKITVLLLFTSCTLVSLGVYWGDPIDCIVEGVPDGVMDTYCWIHSTFTLPRLLPMQPEDEPHPGVGPVYDHEPSYHRYYQWVGFTLLLQGILFLTPYLLWKYLEAGRLSHIIPDCLMHEASDKRMPGFATDIYLIPDCDKKDALEAMKKYFISRKISLIREKRHYFTKFAFCELLNFINVVGQICFLDVFFNGVFTTYGTEVMRMSQEDPENRIDPMNNIFPKVAKCTFSKYGASGTVQNFDGLCILPLNIFNEKVYIIMWFWFVILAVVSGLSLVWRVGTLLSGRIREFVLRHQTSLQGTPDQIAIVTSALSLGDWFILLQIGENIDNRIYAELVSALAASFKPPNQENGRVEWKSSKV